MSRPWDDPAKTGIGWKGDEKEWEEALRLRIAAVANEGDSLFKRQTEFFSDLVEFAERRRLSPRRDRWVDAEGWTFDFDHNRLSRSIVVNVHKAESDWEVTIRSYGAWIYESGSYLLTKCYRSFIMRPDAPRDIFVQTLELAYSDARSYDVHDLDLRPVPHRSSSY